MPEAHITVSSASNDTVRLDGDVLTVTLPLVSWTAIALLSER